MAGIAAAAAAPFTVQHTDGKARAGVLKTAHGVLLTPASMVYTRRGNPVNLTPDMIQRLQPQPAGFQVNIMSL
jgi:queuine/archaeosine tRNA-ribosyltransferase